MQFNPLIGTVIFFAGSVLPTIAVRADEPTSDKPKTDPPAAEIDVREKQLEVTYQARDIERVLSKIKKASELSKKRIVEAAEKAEAVSAALAQGDQRQARTDAQSAAETFREIATLLEALLADEPAPQTAAARDLARNLARLEAELAKELRREMTQAQPASGNGATEKPSDPKPAGKSNERKDDKDPEGQSSGTTNAESTQGKGGKPTQEERRESLVGQAEKLARQGQILEDILKVLAEAPEPRNAELAEKIGAAIKETKVAEAFAAMQTMAAEIRDGRLENAELSARDVADRMAVLAHRLEAAYRTTVAPQVEELRSLEQSVDGLRKKLDDLETQAQIAAWHREAKGVIERAEDAGINEILSRELQQQFNASPGGPANVYDWKVVDDRFVPPDEYGGGLRRLQEELQERIRALLLRDTTSLGDEKTPPKYQELVERYYQVLSSRGGTTSPEPPSSKAIPQGNRAVGK
ncbi:MAG TPA: hypothetical protein VHB77_08270 [Planctomycetaceae bacterium]|nr:hypothetical protein [Planctomycetaceae bacterium]